VLLSLSGTLVLAGGGGFAALENHVVSSYWQGVWWALSLMTTVGFAGASPETTSGRLVSAVLMIAGFGLMTMTTAAIASTLVREEEEPELAAERHFEDLTRRVLTDIADRLERIETMLAIGHEPRPGDVESEQPDDDRSESASSASRPNRERSGRDFARGDLDL
jgi:voltage-gated potassium channel